MKKKGTLARAWVAAVATAAVLMLQSFSSVGAWNPFFSSAEQPPWRSAFETVDADGDGFLTVAELEPLLREHFRRTEQANPDHEMILANEQIFEDQAAEVAGYFEKEGTHGVARFNFDEFEALMVAFMHRQAHGEL